MSVYLQCIECCYCEQFLWTMLWNLLALIFDNGRDQYLNKGTGEDQVKRCSKFIALVILVWHSIRLAMQDYPINRKADMTKTFFL